MEKAIVKLIQTKPFFAQIVMKCKRHFTRDIKTVGVGIDTSLYLKVNPDFWAALCVDGQAGVLEHEVMHVLNHHLDRMDSFPDKQRFNKAADAAINCYIPNIPKNFKMFDKDGKPIVDKKGEPVEFNPVTAETLRLKQGETAEYYYSKIKSDPKDNNKPKSGDNACIDDHDTWGEGDAQPEYVEQKIKQIVTDAMDAVGGRDSGKIPDHVKGLIDEIMHKPKNWKKDLQRFCSRTSEVLTRTTRKKPSRRFGYLYPATKKYPKLTLGVAIDTSGSVSDEELDQFMAEIGRIHKNDVKVWVIECDSKVHQTYIFDPKKKIEVRGRGGTSFRPAFEKAKELEIDGLIYLTDGEDFDRVEKPKFPVLWALLKGCKSRYDWGATTEIEIRRK